MDRMDPTNQDPFTAPAKNRLLHSQGTTFQSNLNENPWRPKMWAEWAEPVRTYSLPQIINRLLHFWGTTSTKTPCGQNVGWMGRTNQDLCIAPANKSFAPLLRNYFSEATSTMPLGGRNLDQMGRTKRDLFTAQRVNRSCYL